MATAVDTELMKYLKQRGARTGVEEKRNRRRRAGMQGHVMHSNAQSYYFL
jgi:hypothetical protein